MSQHHFLPEATPEFAVAPTGNEIRFPIYTDKHSSRARREADK